MNIETNIPLQCAADALLLVLAAAASVDGEVVDSELKEIIRIASLYYDEDEVKPQVDRALASWAVLDTQQSVQLAIDAVNSVTLREITCWHVLDVIYSDGKIESTEKEFLQTLFTKMKLKKTFVNSLELVCDLRNSVNNTKDIWLKKISVANDS